MIDNNVDNMEVGYMNESNLRWLLCSLQLRHKTLVRHGQKRGVPVGDKWVFCPLRKFPRDRISIKVCEKCKHFKGYRRVAVDWGLFDMDNRKIETIVMRSKQKVNKIVLSDKDFEELERKQKEWEKKEKYI